MKVLAKKHLHFCLKTGYWSVKIAIILGLTGLILGAFFVWRVHQSPLDLSFAKGFIQSALHDSATGNHVRLDTVDLYWPDLSDALFLRLGDSAVISPEGDSIFSASKIAMSFSRGGLLRGRLMPKHIIVEEPGIQLKRRADGSVTFGFTSPEKDKPEEPSDESQSEMIARILGYIARPGKEATHDSLIARLEGLEIKHARLFVADDALGMTYTLPDFSAEMVSTDNGMNAKISLPLPEVNGNESGIFANLSYIWDSQNIFIEGDLKKFQISMIAEHVPLLTPYKDRNMILDLQFETLLDEVFMPEMAKLAIWSDDGVIAYDEIFDAPIAYKDLSLEAHYNGKQNQLALTDTSITLNEDITLSLESLLNLDLEDQSNLLNGEFTLKIDKVLQEKIDALWPKPLRGDNSEDWVVTRMSDGTFHDLWATAHIIASKSDEGFDFDAPSVKAGFRFKDMSVDYRAPLDKVTKASGTGGFDLETDILDVTIEEGMIGPMKATNSKLIFDKVVAVGEGGADLQINLAGKIRDVLTYISKDPINLGDRIDKDITQIKGDADLDLRLKFPTQPGVKLEDFDIDISGMLTDTFIPDVVQNLDLSGGPLMLEFKDGLIKVSGKGMLEKRAMDFAWEEFLKSEGKPYKSKVSAKITADPNIRSMLGIDLSDFIEGPVNTELEYTSFADDTAKAEVKVDAASALFFVEPYHFAKPAGAKGSSSFTAHFKKNKLQKITGLKASGDNFSLSGGSLKFITNKDGTALDSGAFKAFKIEETKGKLDFQFAKDGSAKLMIETDFLDAQPFYLPRDKDTAYDEPPMKISVTAKSMRTAPEEIITNATIYMDVDDKGRFNQMEMDARVGKSDLYVRYKPDEQGKRIFRLQTEDAGAFLKAFQVYNDIIGGKLVIYGEPIRGVFDRSIKGEAELTNFKVVNAPVLANLLGIMSLTGIAEILANDGLHFERLEAGFSWLYRQNGSLLVLQNGTTSGNSIGLTFDGTFDNDKRYIDVKGTIIPMSEVNSLIGKIPLVGDLLTGGSGGVFAATYSVKGPSDEPVIGFNPLSVITPGILRRILFE